MSNPTALVQKLWNYCNMGSLAATRSGLRPSAPQNPFRSPPGGSSLKMADEQSRPPFNKPSPIPKGKDWPAFRPIFSAKRKSGVAPYLSYLLR